MASKIMFRACGLVAAVTLGDAHSDALAMVQGALRLRADPEKMKKALEEVGPVAVSSDTVAVRLPDPNDNPAWGEDKVRGVSVKGFSKNGFTAGSFVTSGSNLDPSLRTEAHAVYGMGYQGLKANNKNGLPPATGMIGYAKVSPGGSNFINAVPSKDGKGLDYWKYSSKATVGHLSEEKTDAMFKGMVGVQENKAATAFKAKDDSEKKAQKVEEKVAAPVKAKDDTEKAQKATLANAPKVAAVAANSVQQQHQEVMKKIGEAISQGHKALEAARLNAAKKKQEDAKKVLEFWQKMGNAAQQAMHQHNEAAPKSLAQQKAEQGSHALQEIFKQMKKAAEATMSTPGSRLPALLQTSESEVAGNEEVSDNVEVDAGARGIMASESEDAEGLHRQSVENSNEAVRRIATAREKLAKAKRTIESGKKRLAILEQENATAVEKKEAAHQKRNHHAAVARSYRLQQAEVESLKGKHVVFDKVAYKERLKKGNLSRYGLYTTSDEKQHLGEKTWDVLSNHIFGLDKLMKNINNATEMDMKTKMYKKREAHYAAAQAAAEEEILDIETKTAQAERDIEEGKAEIEQMSEVKSEQRAKQKEVRKQMAREKASRRAAMKEGAAEAAEAEVEEAEAEQDNPDEVVFLQLGKGSEVAQDSMIDAAELQPQVEQDSESVHRKAVESVNGAVGRIAAAREKLQKAQQYLASTRKRITVLAEENATASLKWAKAHAKRMNYTAKARSFRLKQAEVDSLKGKHVIFDKQAYAQRVKNGNLSRYGLYTTTDERQHLGEKTWDVLSNHIFGLDKLMKNINNATEMDVKVKKYKKLERHYLAQSAAAEEELLDIETKSEQAEKDIEEAKQEVAEMSALKTEQKAAQREARKKMVAEKRDKTASRKRKSNKAEDESAEAGNEGAKAP